LRPASRPGVSKVVAVVALVAVVSVAGAALYLTSSYSCCQSTTSTTTKSSPLYTLTVSPTVPLISPGQTQNYTTVEVNNAFGFSPTQNMTMKVFSPAGLTVTLENATISLANDPQSMSITMKAASSLAPGNYTVTIEGTPVGVKGNNQTLDVEVVPMLVTIQDLAFHPQNLTVAAGTRVYWINLDYQIGCCDPGNHNVVFLSGATGNSPTLKRLDSWSYLFSSPGVVEYYCSIHPLIMKGQVTVTG